MFYVGPLRVWPLERRSLIKNKPPFPLPPPGYKIRGVVFLFETTGDAHLSNTICRWTSPHGVVQANCLDNALPMYTQIMIICWLPPHTSYLPPALARPPCLLYRRVAGNADPSPHGHVEPMAAPSQVCASPPLHLGSGNAPSPPTGGCPHPASTFRQVAPSRSPPTETGPKPLSAGWPAISWYHFLPQGGWTHPAHESAGRPARQGKAGIWGGNGVEF